MTQTTPHPKHPLSWLQAAPLQGPSLGPNLSDASEASLEPRARSLTWKHGQADQVHAVHTRREDLNWKVTLMDRLHVHLQWTLQIGGTRGEKFAGALQARQRRGSVGFSMRLHRLDGGHDQPCAVLRLPGRRILIPGEVSLRHGGVRLSRRVNATLLGSAIRA